MGGSRILGHGGACGTERPCLPHTHSRTASKLGYVPPLYLVITVHVRVCTHVSGFQVAEAASLSWGTRIKGFIACFATGVLCSLLVRPPSSPARSFLHRSAGVRGERAEGAGGDGPRGLPARGRGGGLPAMRRPCSVFQGTLLLWVPRKGLYLFVVFYTLGNIASIGR